MASQKTDTLRAALLGFELSSAASPHFGEGPATAAPSPSGKQVDTLRRDLQRIVRSNETYFRIWVGMLLILFAGACVYVSRSLADPKNIAAVFAATGVSVMGVVAKMTSLWKEKVNSDLLLSLVGTLSPEETKKVVDSLLKSYLKNHK